MLFPIYKTGSVIRHLAIISISISALLLAACTSHVPLDIKQPPTVDLPLAQVINNIKVYTARKVRWGGVILDTENRENATWLTIMAQPLDSNGRPEDIDSSPGRFIVIIEDFLEPRVYSQDREITITGTIWNSETGKVGEYVYNYPVIKAERYYLWPEKLAYDNYPAPNMYYDPWYHPYTPYYPYHIHHYSQPHKQPVGNHMAE